MTTQTKALELIIEKLVERGYSPEKSMLRLHQAAFLATIEAASEVMGSRVTPTPLYRISYNEQSTTLEFRFLEGRGLVPNSDAIDIDYADLVFASLQCDRIALLSEGTTGTGKTYTLEHVLKTVYDGANIRGLRLNPNMSNVLQPYIEGRVDPQEGVLRVNINREAVREIAALFIDEQNRGDTNAVLGLLDNQVILPTGERADLGLSIPQIKILPDKSVHISFSEDYVKPVAVHSAQNPPDAQYTGTRKTDGAVGNRQVRITYPNMAIHSGAATVNMNDRDNHHHEAFMRSFTVKLASYMGIDKQAVNSLMVPQDTSLEEKARANQEYLSVHAASFDPARARNLFLKSAVEGADHIITLTGGKNLESNFRDEVEIAQEWTKVLTRYGVNFNYNTSIDTHAEVMLRVDVVRAAFSEQLIERDKTKATKVADALALITRYKKAYDSARKNESSPFNEFKAMEGPLTVRDIASAYAIVLQDKIQGKKDVSPVSIINQAFTDYVSLWEGISSRVYGRPTPFNLTDKNQSIRYLCSYVAVDAVKTARSYSPDQYATVMITELGKVASVIRSLDSGSDTKKMLIARINADLASLAGFIDMYKADIATAFNLLEPSDKVLPRYTALTEIVRKARGAVQTNYTLPRVERVFGI